MQENEKKPRYLNNVYKQAYKNREIHPHTYTQTTMSTPSLSLSIYIYIYIYIYVYIYILMIGTSQTIWYRARKFGTIPYWI